MASVLADVVPFLACPHCHGDVAMAGTSVRCGNGHVFDVARQGYVSLLPGGARPAGDTPAMVSARAAFLATGHFAPLAREVAAHAAAAHAAVAHAAVAHAAVAHAAAAAGGAGGGRCVVDAGAGTGYYLSAALDRLGAHCGLALDVSKHAARRAARAHPRAGAVVADVRGSWPVRDSVAGVVLNVFAPRHAAEMHRVLAPGGSAVVVTPARAHLRELVEGLGLITVDEDKRERLERTMSPFFRLAERQPCHAALTLRPEHVRLLAGMGPSAWHRGEAELRERSQAMPDPALVTLAVEISVYQPLRSPGRAGER
jgi:23S rRNA (guanine745-N1)-methyltransferase